VSFKLEGPTEEGLCIERPSKTPEEMKVCVACQAFVNRDCVLKCSQCDSGCFCSEECKVQGVATNEHQLLCMSIQHLEEIQMDSRLKALPLKEKCQVSVKRRLVGLVGEKPIVHCRIGVTEAEALWDTGAQVSMVDKSWVNSTHPDAEIDSLEDFLKGDNLHLFSANNCKISVHGVVTLNVEIGGFSIPVPFIVSSDPVTQPIIGYNVIKHLIFEGGDESENLLKVSCPGILKKNVSAVVSLIREEVVKEDFVTTTKRVIVPANSRCQVKCRTKYRASEVEESVMFTPNPIDTELELEEIVTKMKLGRGHTQIMVRNPTNFPVVLDKGVTIGSIEAVSAVIPLMPNDVNVEGDVVSRGPPDAVGPSVSSIVEDVDGGADWLPPVDLSHLSGERKEMVEKVLREESEVFCKEGMLHGDVPEMVMDINLTDPVPVVIPHRNNP
jgi:hypothetical protein